MATNVKNLGYGAAAAVNPIVAGATIGLDALGNLFGGDADRELQERQIELLERRYGDRAPFRAMSLARLSADRPTRPDLTADFADPSNPFYHAPQPLSFGKNYQSPGASAEEKKLKAKGLSSLVEGPRQSALDPLRQKYADKGGAKAAKGLDRYLLSIFGD